MLSSVDSVGVMGSASPLNSGMGGMGQENGAGWNFVEDKKRRWFCVFCILNYSEKTSIAKYQEKSPLPTSF